MDVSVRGLLQKYWFIQIGFIYIEGKLLQFVSLHEFYIKLIWTPCINKHILCYCLYITTIYNQMHLSGFVLPATHPHHRIYCIKIYFLCWVLIIHAHFTCHISPVCQSFCFYEGWQYFKNSLIILNVLFSMTIYFCTLYKKENSLPGWNLYLHLYGTFNNSQPCNMQNLSSELPQLLG